MTAVADLVSGTIHAAIEIEAPPEVVFAAMTEPEQLSAWWGSPESYRTSNWKLDLRPGGKWSCEAKNVSDGRVSTVGGQYLEVDPPRLLVYTWAPSWENFAETTIRMELTATSLGTRVKVTHTGFGDRTHAGIGHASGWKSVLSWLATHARRRA